MTQTVHGNGATPLLVQVAGETLGADLRVGSHLPPGLRFALPAYTGTARGLLASLSVLEPDGMAELASAAGIALPPRDRLVWTFREAEGHFALGLSVVPAPEPDSRPTGRPDPVPTVLERLEQRLDEVRRRPPVPGSEAERAREIASLERQIALERERRSIQDQ